ncbi:amylo-alpha-1,6-glucosidase [Calothrix sp. UHCC 0171]|uniref:amylo-alpha-1,6-glucosidase n=1 Tax=Calothrix sp. UHCC 0171 TaxID=3110245 RepID=UPI002B207413|nr:amylo-alpha-1,6-glucosidase [Calothrix sp. UHCC 0171]MEA5574423.1 amylo-alpha-1,6-glucosidase [Calothrix sp. UHCC 0171]
MKDLDAREWILTNGLGGFAGGTVTDIRTRTYHGWLFAATEPPSVRNLLLSHLETSLELPERTIALGTNIWGNGLIDPNGYRFLRSFEINPIPKWIWGGNDWQLTRLLIMPHWQGGNGKWVKGKDEKKNNLLIQYRYEGVEVAVLRLRLLTADRNLHHQQTKIPELQFSQMLSKQQVCLQAIIAGHFGIPWHLRWTKGEYQPDAVWYWSYALSEETQRGLSDREDLYSPGYLSVILQPGDTVTLEAQLGFPEQNQKLLTSTTFDEAVEIEQERLCQIFDHEEGKLETKPGEKEDKENLYFFLTFPTSHLYKKLLQASEQFIVYRQSTDSLTVIAGYHWFNDWGRDTLIALPGLTLTTGRYGVAKEILASFGNYCRYGLIPNAFPDVNREPLYNSMDTALWWVETLGLYLEATHDWEFLIAQYPMVQQIYKALIGGTRYNIQVDSTDGLVSWDNRGVALTWMDAVVDGQPVTPRRGKPVEVNALWYSCLCWASRWAEILSEHGDVTEQGRLAKQARRYTMQAEQVKTSLQKFWNSQSGYLFDTIEPDDRRNAQIRPNAVLALSFAHCAFSVQQGQSILDLAQSCLLTPYGLRSLNPSDPDYIGQYVGNQQQRDRAYHQGTVWCWLIGAFIRGWQRFYIHQPLPFDWQPLLQHFTSEACIGSISEIFDGDAPHIPRGAIAQAKSVAEVIRHVKIVLS